MSATARPTDEELLAQWTAGDKRAGAGLVERHHDSIARFFHHRLGPETQDLVQDTFMGLLEAARAGRFRGDAKVRTYLFKIARNQLLRRIRDHQRDRARFDPGQHSIADVEPTPTALMMVQDQHKLLVAALRRLPFDVQIMLELHYWEKMKVREIVEVLDVNANTVKAKLARGRRRLLEEMAAIAESKEQLQTTLHRISGWVAQLREVAPDLDPDADADA